MVETEVIFKCSQLILEDQHVIILQDAPGKKKKKSLKTS